MTCWQTLNRFLSSRFFKAALPKCTLHSTSGPRVTSCKLDLPTCAWRTANSCDEMLRAAGASKAFFAYTHTEKLWFPSWSCQSVLCLLGVCRKAGALRACGHIKHCKAMKIVHVYFSFESVSPFEAQRLHRSAAHIYVLGCQHANTLFLHNTVKEIRLKHLLEAMQNLEPAGTFHHSCLLTCFHFALARQVGICKLELPKRTSRHTLKWLRNKAWRVAGKQRAKSHDRLREGRRRQTY